MKLLRSFLPVGQGAFYVEKFVDDNGERVFTAVYDCGTMSKPFNLDATIYHCFHADEIIDALFISHFHEDHINGVSILLQRCDVQNIFIPYTTPDEKLLLGLYYCHCVPEPEKREEYLKLLYNPERTLSPNGVGHIHYVTAPEEQISESNKSVSVLKSGKNALTVLEKAISLPWIFKPFTYKRKELLKKFQEQFDGEFDGTLSPQQLPAFYNTHKDKIVEAFRGVKVDINITTMLLYSGPIQAISAKIHMVRCWQQCHSTFSFLETTQPGCLYTGDAKLSVKKDMNAVVKFYEDVWDDLGCFQIPHHGAWDSFNTEIANFKMSLFLSAGLYNKYGHPHVKVYQELFMQKSNWFHISEFPCSGVTFEVDIR